MTDRTSKLAEGVNVVELSSWRVLVGVGEVSVDVDDHYRRNINERPK
jgi:hypothetical protein